MIACVALAASASAQNWVAQESGSKAGLRGIAAVDASIVWASGTGGAVLRTINGGASWEARTVPGASGLDFRAVQALDRDRAWVMSSGPGDKSRIYGTSDGGAHWQLLYTNPDANGFFDALSFWDARHGAVLGDPVNGEFVLLLTGDGGAIWRRQKLPPALKDEGAFAASNTSLIVRDGRFWFASGGPPGARVFRSANGARHWEVSETPVRHDGPGAGIFSMSFAGNDRAIAVGGDYGKPDEDAANVAVTKDGGRTWKIPTGSHPHGYRSGVAYLPGHKAWIAVGTTGSDVSMDDGATWKLFDQTSYNAVAVSGGSAWAAGAGGRIAKLDWP